jgi:CheY-like chemotaxis protein
MAKILIVEPHPEVRDLLVRVVSRLGLEAVVYDDPVDLATIDVVLVEPEHWGATEIARAAERASGARIVCVSIAPPSEESLDLAPFAHVLKPFSLAELERAVLSALEWPERVLRVS